jgi:hypothetical protein
VLGENAKLKSSGSDVGGLLADLVKGARRRNLSANSLAAYERTWKAFLAWAAAAGLDPRALSFPKRKKPISEIAIIIGAEIPGAAAR